jgi:hypothetical protein
MLASFLRDDELGANPICPADNYRITITNTFQVEKPAEPAK